MNKNINKTLRQSSYAERIPSSGQYTFFVIRWPVGVVLISTELHTSIRRAT